MRILSIIANRGRTTLLGACAVLCFSTVAAYSADCKAGKGLTSNNVRWLTALGDTLWTITDLEQSLSFTMIAGKEALESADKDGNWWSYSLDCRSEGVNELALGGGYAAASFDTVNNVLWLYDFKTSKIREYGVSWPDLDSLYTVTITDMVYSNSSFFCAAGNGGVVKWDYLANKKRLVFPGNRTVFDLAVIKSDEFPPADSMTAVTAVEMIDDDSLLLVVTPGKLWQFSIVDTVWDSTITTSISDSDCKFKQFEYVFINKTDKSRPLYALVGVERKGSEGDTTYLCKYNRSGSVWDVLLTRAPKALTFGHGGYLYMLFDEERPGSALRNIVKLYRDSLGDSGCYKNPVPVKNEQYFNTRMTSKYEVDYPDELTDIVYVPKSDSTGYLWIATSAGLFFSENETPPTDTGSFLLIKRAPIVKGGLQTTYARPGILTPSSSGCVFVYNIKKARARVTIKVYDYNMDLVKTVIDKKTRLSGDNGGPLGRSTVESEDRWDGKSASGRLCAPGIYYYKITTDSGERSFGKIVIAR